jgi:hypothetical protein
MPHWLGWRSCPFPSIPSLVERDHKKGRERVATLPYKPQIFLTRNPASKGKPLLNCAFLSTGATQVYSWCLAFPSPRPEAAWARLIWHS